MKQQPKPVPLIKQPLVIGLLAAVVILLGSVIYLSQKKNSSQLQGANSASSHQDAEGAVDQNSTYGEVHALFRNPTDNTILMGTHKGLFKSTDDGKTFTQETPGVMGEFMNFAYDATNKTLYAGGHDLGVVKSTDGGATWTKADSGIKGTDIHALALNPLEPNRVYAYSVDNGVFGTKDGGKSWNRIDDGPANSSVRSFGYMATASSMDRSMKTDQTTNIGYLWAGTGGGLYSSFACFCGWTKTNALTDNATVYTIAPDPINRSNMLVGTKDGIYKTTDEAKSFTKVNDAIKNVAAITFDIQNPSQVLAVTGNGTLYKSMDAGNTWQPL